MCDKNGKWKVLLPPMEPGGPYTLTIRRCRNCSVTLNDIYVGDVWLASGQSNMEMEYDFSGEFNSKIRVWNYSPHFPSKSSLKWQMLGDRRRFSHVAGNFIKFIYTDRHIPVGIICAAIGGSSLLRIENLVISLSHFPIKGIIWWQGETEALDYSGKSYEEYELLFRRMITKWRKAWKQDELPFIYCQLQNYLPNAKYSIAKNNKKPGYLSWPIVRQAQLEALKLKKTAMIVLSDITNGDVHPNARRIVSYRMALAALGQVYRKNVEFSGPIYDQYKYKGDRILLYFTHVGEGLVK
ncbi:hypothetical protein KA005_62825, partial [bacterium]|nr:hypothetical protein [bacterium]